MQEGLSITDYWSLGLNDDIDIQVTNKEAHLLQHTLGYVDQGYIAVRNAEWRNHFDNGSQHGELLDHLVELELMELKEIAFSGNTHYVYHVTDLGKRVARKTYVNYVLAKRKEVKKSSRRWAAYLSDSEAYDDDFGLWLRLKPKLDDWAILKLEYGI